MTGVRPFEVIGGAVVLRTLAGSSQYLYKGAPFDASAYTVASVEHALSSGLVAELEVIEVDEVASESADGEADEVIEVDEVASESADGVEVPEGAPGKAWTHEQIDAWAARQPTPILLEAYASKDAKLAAIAAIQS